MTDDTVPAEPQLVDVDGAPLNVLSLGAGAGVPVVMIHGFGGDLNAFMFNWSALAASRRVLVLDLPAHGSSPPRPGVVAAADFADVVRSTLDAFGIARAHLVGHSFGGTVALALAQREPARVASLALVAPTGLGPSIDGTYIDAFVAAEDGDHMHRALEMLWADPMTVTPEMVAYMLDVKRRPGVGPAQRAIAATFHDGDRQTLDLRQALCAFPGPALVVWGTEDAIVPPSDADGLPPAIRVERLAGAAHMPMWEQASAFDALLVRHLTDADGGGA